MEGSESNKPQESSVAWLKGEITRLRSEIENLKQSEDPASYLDYLNSTIDEILAKTTEKALTITQQTAEKDWIQFKYPKSSEILHLKSEIKLKSAQLRSAEEKILKDQKKLLEIQKLQQKDPKLYNLVQKLLQAEQKNLNLKRSLAASEDQKKDLRTHYAKITAAFTQEESIKKKIKELTPQVSEKEETLRNLSKKLEITKRLTEDTIENIENSIVKEIIKNCSEVSKLRENLDETKSTLQREYYELVYKIDQAEKNPEKIAPHVANQNLRQEAKTLEAQITERSKEEKERQKEKFQLTFKYENSLKELESLKNHLDMLEGRTEKVKDSKVVSKKSTLQSEKRVNTVQSASCKVFDAQRTSVIEILGQGITDGMGEKVMKALKNVGKPGQGLASKVLELNRSQFLSSKSLLSS